MSLTTADSATIDKARLAAEHRQSDNKTLFGFWVYLMTDCILFASLFATYAVLHNNTFGGPSAKELFSMPYALTETLILLTSSFTCGLAVLSAINKHKRTTLIWFSVTFILGVSFLVLEISEFSKFIAAGHGPKASGFMSSYFTLVGTHGLHITIGLLWMLVMMIRIYKTDLNRKSIRQLTLLSLFWHFLDVIWIFIFSVVYLMGGLSV
jgi:cytochrome o ubiquinol oxidase subunit III